MTAQRKQRTTTPPTARTPRKTAVLAEPRMDGSVTHDQIARKAYELWIARGGDAESNWYEAERMLKQSDCRAEGQRHRTA